MMKRKTALLTATSLIFYALFAAVIVGCFSPDFSTATILCSADKPECPPEYTCEAPYCVPKSTAGQADQAVGSTDAAMTGDMAFPPDMTTRKGCADGKGYPVGSAWACPGGWGPYLLPPKPAVSLCASGFSVCKSANPFISPTALQECRSLFQSTLPSEERSDSTWTQYNSSRLRARSLTRICRLASVHRGSRSSGRSSPSVAADENREPTGNANTGRGSRNAQAMAGPMVAAQNT